MGKKNVRIPVHQQVRFEVVNHQQLYLRKIVQVVIGPGEVAEVDVAIDMSLREWKRLQKAIRKARDRKKEKITQQMLVIERRTLRQRP